jgi:hypothetical protein
MDQRDEKAASDDERIAGDGVMKYGRHRQSPVFTPKALSTRHPSSKAGFHAKGIGYTPSIVEGRLSRQRREIF